MTAFKDNNGKQSITDVLKDFTQKYRLQGGIDQVRVQKAWVDVAGKSISKKTISINLKEGVLLIHLSSSALREELNYGKQKIIEQINRYLKSDVVKKIELR